MENTVVEGITNIRIREEFPQGFNRTAHIGTTGSCKRNQALAVRIQSAEKLPEVVRHIVPPNREAEKQDIAVRNLGCFRHCLRKRLLKTIRDHARAGGEKSAVDHICLDFKLRAVKVLGNALCNLLGAAGFGTVDDHCFHAFFLLFSAPKARIQAFFPLKV